MVKKKCTKCGHELPIDSFGAGSGPNGLSSWCKGCHKKAAETRRPRNAAANAITEQRIEDVYGAIVARPGMEASEIVQATGFSILDVRGALLSLLHRTKIRSVPARHGKTRRYEANVIAATGPIDAYLNRRIKLPEPSSSRKYGAQDKPVRSPEPPSRRVFGIQSSFTSF